MRTLQIVTIACALASLSAAPVQAHGHRRFFGGLLAPAARYPPGVLLPPSAGPAFVLVDPPAPPPVAATPASPHLAIEQPASTAQTAEALATAATPAAPLVEKPVEKTVEIGAYDDYFQPATITIEVGTTVRWTNLGQHNHTVTVYDNTWESGELAAGASFTATFHKPGIYSYFCRHHARAGMTGTVIVTDAAGRNPANGRRSL